jgi:hypothetical protein
VNDWQPTPILGTIPVGGRLFCLAGYGDTTQMRHSMPQEAARASSSCPTSCAARVVGTIEPLW